MTDTRKEEDKKNTQKAVNLLRQKEYDIFADAIESLLACLSGLEKELEEERKPWHPFKRNDATTFPSGEGYVFLVQLDDSQMMVDCWNFNGDLVWDECSLDEVVAWRELPEEYKSHSPKENP